MVFWRHLSCVILTAALLCFGASTGQAQDTATVVVPPTTDTLIGPPAPADGHLPDFGAFVPDYAAWETVAKRAEDVVMRDVASQFRLNRQRVDLVIWRNLFSGLLNDGQARIATLESQIASLGPIPVDGQTEDETVTARRAVLQIQRDKVAAPRLLVEEAFARADGLIAEIDRMIRARKADALLERGQSPLSPPLWMPTLAELGKGIRELWLENMSSLSRDLESGALWTKLPLALLYLAASIALIWRGRQWLARKQFDAAVEDVTVIRAFALGLAQLAVPLIGVVALTLALVTLNTTGLRTAAVFSVLPLSALIVVVGLWINGQFFPPPPRFGPLGYNHDTRKRLRRVATTMTWVAAIWLPLLKLLDEGNTSAVSQAVFNFPVVSLLSLLLYRFGQLLRRAPAADLPEGHRQNGRIRRIAGQFCKLIAIAAPVLAALGYAALAEGLILPTVVSLAVLAVVIYFQRMVNEIYAAFAVSRGRKSETLVPVLIGFALLLLALPLLALIWGASPSDLLEVWTRFREGFSVGESKISPTDFLTFAAVFTGGYLLTRLIQGTLRTSVLPRTRLDLGAQNALVAGFGYVGIGLSSIFAITSAGLDLSNFAIVAGALSVGIGFGLQNIVSNFVAGIILLIERPVSEGDWIEVGGKMGYVRDISVRSTRIETFDRTDVIVPNADLVSNQVINWTRGNLIGRVVVPIGVAYGTDVEKVQTILRDIAESHPLVLMNPPPNVMFMGFGASSLDFEIRAILRDVNFIVHTQSEMNFAIAKRFAEEGIEIPFPQQDIWLRNPEVLRGPKTEEGT